MMRQFQLVEKVASYDSNINEDLLNRAYVFAMKAHGSQKRASGDPYFSHPLEVAGILTEYHLDCASIITALLHDTVEDTLATLDELEQQFGNEIAKLVDGVTKLSKLEMRSEEDKQAENFRKLVLAMSDDIRVLLVKLADRLHNMRTLHHLKKPDKRRRIAIETMEIYAPLAERIGVHKVKEELEDLAFAEINPEARESVLKRIAYLGDRTGEITEQIEVELRRILQETGLKIQVSGRAKRPISIWRKMERDNVSFEQLSDIVGFRIITQSVSECYQALGVVHGHYPMVPGGFKDYVSTPKRNNYRSIHTTVVGPQNQRIEVQIRTQQMHEVAEYGVAAHWRYKQNDYDLRSAETYRWLQELVELLGDTENPVEFLDNTKLEMFHDQVFCFTPGGDVIRLPNGATPVDFAYAVHTDIGNTCVGAKVNGVVVKLRQPLNNGDQVEILRTKTPGPDPAWESYVVTGRARSAIRRFIRNRERDQYRDLGRAIAEKAFTESRHEFSDKAVSGILRRLQLESVDDVYVQLGQGHMTSQALLAMVFPGERRWGAMQALNKMLPARLRRNTKKQTGSALSIRGLIPGMALHYADCCHPLPGDRIVGIVTKGKGVIVHTIDCKQLSSVPDDPQRWLDVQWDLDAAAPEIHVGRIVTKVSNQKGSLGKLSTVIGNNEGNISNLQIDNRTVDFFDMVIDIEVTDVKHLTNIIAALRAMLEVSSVERVRG